MVFFSLSNKAKSFAYAIHKFQHNIDHKKASCIDLAVKNLVNCITATEPKEFLPCDISRKKTIATKGALSRFYDSF